MPGSELDQRPLLAGRRLRQLRKTAGKTQMELARELGVNQAHVSHIEAGRGDMSVAMVVRLAQMFGVTTDYLVGLEDAPAPAAKRAGVRAGGGAAAR